MDCSNRFEVRTRNVSALNDLPFSAAAARLLGSATDGDRQGQSSARHPRTLLAYTHSLA
jgi:hypothetical protein